LKDAREEDAKELQYDAACGINDHDVFLGMQGKAEFE